MLYKCEANISVSDSRLSNSIGTGINEKWEGIDTLAEGIEVL